MNKDKLVNGFIIGTFVSLYLLVSIISTIHVIDFFELSNPRWMAITLAIGFEIGAAASLASLIVMKKMNKTLVWALFITITAMQINGNLYYAFINMQDYQNWVELFNLLEWEPLAQKRLLAAVSGAILPLVALGFIKSLVDYIKPEEELDVTDEQLDEITAEINNSLEKKTKVDSQIPVEEIEVNEPEIVNANPLDLSEQDVETMLDAIENPPAPNEKLKEEVNKFKGESEDKFEDLEVTLMDGLDELDDESWDEDHALDEVLNDMVEDSVESIEEPVKTAGISQQATQPETRVVNNDKRYKKGPLWEYRTNYEDDDKFD